MLRSCYNLLELLFYCTQDDNGQYKVVSTKNPSQKRLKGKASSRISKSTKNKSKVKDTNKLKNLSKAKDALKGKSIGKKKLKKKIKAKKKTKVKNKDKSKDKSDALDPSFSEDMAPLVINLAKSAFSSSSQWKKRCAAHFASFKASNKGWCPKEKKKSWLQVDLGREHRIFKIAIRCDIANEYTTEYKLQYSNDSHKWNDVNGSPFKGVLSGDGTVEEKVLDEDVRGRYFRWLPTKYNQHPSLRVELWGTDIFPLVRDLPKSAFSCSSSWDAKSRAHFASFKGASDGWSPRFRRNCWLLVDLGSKHRIRKIGLKCEMRLEYTEEYELEYSNDSFTWFTIRKSPFEGVSAGDGTVVRHTLSEVVEGRYFGWIPSKYQQHPSMRVELWGYKVDEMTDMVRTDRTKTDEIKTDEDIARIELSEGTKGNPKYNRFTNEEDIDEKGDDKALRQALIDEGLLEDLSMKA